MLRYFQPKMYLKSYQDLNIAVLKELNIKLIICDIDNTLVPHTTKEATSEVREFIDKLLKADFLVALVSNNNKTRVKIFADSLNLNYYASANKPLKKVYKKILKDYKMPTCQTVAIGDQLMTDILGANRAGIFSILTDPLVNRDIIYTKVNRFLEGIVYTFLNKKELLIKGTYYDHL